MAESHQRIQTDQQLRISCYDLLSKMFEDMLARQSELISVRGSSGQNLAMQKAVIDKKEFQPVNIEKGTPKGTEGPLSSARSGSVAQCDHFLANVQAISAGLYLVILRPTSNDFMKEKLLGGQLSGPYIIIFKVSSELSLQEVKAALIKHQVIQIKTDQLLLVKKNKSNQVQVSQEVRLCHLEDGRQVLAQGIRDLPAISLQTLLPLESESLQTNRNEDEGTSHSSLNEIMGQSSTQSIPVVASQPAQRNEGETLRVALTIEDNHLQRERMKVQTHTFMKRVKKSQLKQYHMNATIHHPKQAQAQLISFLKIATGAPRGFSLSKRIIASKMQYLTKDYMDEEDDDKGGEKSDVFDEEIMKASASHFLSKFIKRLLSQSGDPEIPGIVIIYRSKRGAEENLVNLFKTISDQIAKHKEFLNGQRFFPKIFIIVNNKVREDQVGKLITKYLNSIVDHQKDQNQEITLPFRFQSNLVEQQRGGASKEFDFDVNDVNIMLNKMIFIRIGHASLFVENFDVLVFDEGHAAINCDHIYKQTMFQWYFNCIKHQPNRKLPIIICYINLFKILSLISKDSNKRLVRLTQLLQQLANIFYSDIVMLDTPQIMRIQLNYLSEHLIIRFDPKIPHQAMLIALRNLQFDYLLLLLWQNEGALEIKPYSEIFTLNKMPEHLYFITEPSGKYQSSKLAFTDSKRMIEVFSAKTQEIFAQVDVPRNDRDDASLRTKSTADTESKMKKHPLKHYQGIYRPEVQTTYIKKENQQKYYSSRIIVDDIIRLFLSDSVVQEIYQDNIFSLDPSFQPQDQQNLQCYIFRKQSESQNYVLMGLCKLLYQRGFIKPDFFIKEDMVRQAIFYPYQDNKEEEKSDDLSDSTYKSNLQPEVSQNMQDNIFQQNSQMILQDENTQDNYEKLKQIISHFVNPIITAIKIYKKQSAENPDQFKWGPEVCSQSPHKLLGSAQSKVMEDLIDDLDLNKDKLRDMEELITEELEVGPLYLIDSEFPKLSFLLFLILSLLEKKPPWLPLINPLKEELGRLEFVGEQAIDLCTTLHLFFNQDLKNLMNARDLASKKQNITKTSNLSRKATTYGLYGLKRKGSAAKRPRKSEDLVKSIAGLFSIYLGLEAAYLFLCEIRILQSEMNPLDNSADVEERVQQHLSFVRYLSNRTIEMTQTNQKGMAALVEEIIKVQSQDQRFEIEDLQRFVHQATTLDRVDGQDQKVIGYEFKNNILLLQAYNHQSSNLEVLIRDRDLTLFHNDCLLELGESLISFTISKQLYLDTAIQREQWQEELSSARKLNKMKTWFEKPSWLAYLLCEHYFYYFVLEKIQMAEQGFPAFPMFCNSYEQQFKKESHQFQNWIFSEISKKQNQANLKTAFSLNSFQYQNGSQDEFDYSELDEQALKIFSQIMIRLIGAILIDSRDLGTLTQCILSLMSSRNIKIYPVKEDIKSKVMAIWESKRYTKGVSLTHTKEETDKGTRYKAYADKVEIKRIVFKLDQKNKLNKFFVELDQYLEWAYGYFEEQVMFGKIKDLDQKSWLLFNKEVRNKFDSQSIKREKQAEIFNSIAKNIYKLEQKNEKLGIKESLDKAYKKYLMGIEDKEKQKKIDKKFILYLESERVRDQSCYDVFEKCDINSLIQSVDQVGRLRMKDFFFDPKFVDDDQLQEFYELLKIHGQKKQLDKY